MLAQRARMGCGGPAHKDVGAEDSHPYGPCLLSGTWGRSWEGQCPARVESRLAYPRQRSPISTEGTCISTTHSQ